MSVFEMIKFDEDIIVLSSQDGRYTMKQYQVFPGIDLIYNNVHVESIDFENQKNSSCHTFEISYCKEGRAEYHVNDEFCFIGPGDLAIARTQHISSGSFFPLSHYHGITIRIDLKKVPECLSYVLNDVVVKPADLASKYCNRQSVFIARSHDVFEDIFSKIYTVPRQIQKGLLKIKVLELLLYLSMMQIEQDQASHYHQSQVDLAKRISAYLAKHKDEHVTLDQLTEVFHISKTQMKCVFKSVYGVSIGAFHRTLKMESAAYLLESTDKSVLEIASEHGYDNASKFANAFRSIKGISPSEYRKKNRNNV